MLLPGWKKREETTSLLGAAMHYSLSTSLWIRWKPPNLQWFSAQVPKKALSPWRYDAFFMTHTWTTRGPKFTNSYIFIQIYIHKYYPCYIQDLHPIKKYIPDKKSKHPNFLPHLGRLVGPSRRIGTWGWGRNARSRLARLDWPWLSPCGNDCCMQVCGRKRSRSGFHDCMRYSSWSVRLMLSE